MTEQAQAQGLDGTAFHVKLYLVAFAQGDQSAMKRQVEALRGRMSEYEMLELDYEALAFSGRLSKSREISSRVMSIFLNRDMKDNAAQTLANDAVDAALVGDSKRARELAQKAITLSSNKHILVYSSLALSLCGEASQSQALIAELARRYPKDTEINSIWIPVIKAQIETYQGDAAMAIQLLHATNGYEMGAMAGFWPNYFRGQAYLRRGAGSEAVIEFQKITDRRGVDVTSILYPLAHLGLAQAAAVAGDSAMSRKAYEGFRSLWKDADPNLPLFQKLSKNTLSKR
jgi:hypothetical protein